MLARAILLTLLMLAPAMAAETPAVRSPRAVATLVTDSDAAAPGQAFRAGLRLVLAPGWHVYWRNPGAAGMPTEVTPALPDGAVAGPVAWPAPERLTEAGITVYGYTGTVVLPFAVTPGAQAGGAFHLSAHADWLVCQSVCVPEEGEFDLDLPWGTPAPSGEASLLAAALAQVPGAAPFEASVSPSGVLTLSGPGLRAGEVRGASFFPDAADTVADSAEQAFSVGDGQVRLRLTPGTDFHPGAFTGVVELRDASGTSRAVTVAPGAGPEPVASGDEGYGWTLVLAFAGGLLLNLMPCVFPILAMKAAGLARLGGAGQRTVRVEALGYTAGVLATFCGLGGAVALAGGGWGTQFQSPVFVTAAAWLLFAVGLSLSGVWTTDALGAGSRWVGRAGPVGAFLTGALAVGVAAPCTAPFMGTAVAAALTLPAAAALGVFAAMGAGLAAPYLLLAAWPGAARALPRPGRWMVLLKGALAFPMYAAAAWLVWVVSTEAGTSGVLVAVSGLVLVGFAAWVWTVSASGRRSRMAGRGMAAAALLLAAVLLPQADGGSATPAAEPFSAERLATLRAQGRPVFVDMTASWCLPCLFNERVALSPAAVQRAFAERHVAVLRGDWTRKDPAITAFLRSQDRDGVPLYVFYPPGGAAVVLPQVLTAGIVLDRIGHGRS